MESVTSLLLFGAAAVAAVGSVSIWLALKRPARALLRRQRDEALAAAQAYTPAERASPYGAQPDPCAPGLSDNERVEAMRALLLRGDARDDASLGGRQGDLSPTQPQALRDDPQTTSPMAWKPTLPPDEADAWEALRQDSRPGSIKVKGARPADADADHEHITV